MRKLLGVLNDDRAERDKMWSALGRMILLHRFLKKTPIDEFLKDEGTYEAIQGVAVKRVLTWQIAAEGGKADIAKPMKGLGSGIFEIALRHRGNAFRVVYGVQLGEELWVVDAFQKKSTQGIKTPQREIDLIRDRLKRLKEMLR